MAQEDIRQLLLEMDGRGSTGEIARRAREKFPDRTYHTYVGQLLRRLEDKGFVEKENDHWVLSERGKETSIEGVPVVDIDVGITGDELREDGFDIVNIVATTDLERELDLFSLSKELSRGEYHPESSPYLIYRPSENSSTTLLVPSNGMISIVGAKSKDELLVGTGTFFDALDSLGVHVDRAPKEALVQNIVLKGNLKTELDLATVSVGLGLERSEYEPEQFPGIVHRLEDGSVSLLFRTGKYLVIGTKTYAQAIDSASVMQSKLEAIGIEPGQ